MANKTREKRTVKTAETIFGIVETLREEEEASLTELAEALDMPRSTLHPHLVTLIEQKHLVKEDNRYRLGMKFIDLGTHVKESSRLYQLSGPILQQLATQTKELAWLLTEEYGVGVLLRITEGELAIDPQRKVGSRVPLHNIATGKAILANLPEERVHEIIDNQGLPARTANTITDVDELFSELRVIRDTGIAFNDCELFNGYRAVASPIRPEERVYGAIGVSAPKNRIRDKRFTDEIPEIVLGAANALELQVMNNSA